MDIEMLQTEIKDNEVHIKKEGENITNYQNEINKLDTEISGIDVTKMQEAAKQGASK